MVVVAVDYVDKLSVLYLEGSGAEMCNGDVVVWWCCYFIFVLLLIFLFSFSFLLSLPLFSFFTFLHFLYLFLSCGSG
jgi:hypothetical protein